MTAELPVGIAAWLRFPVSFFLTILLLASGGEATAAGRVSVDITSPSTRSSFSTSSATLALAGIASATTGVKSVVWQNYSGGSGTATGTGNWSVGGIRLTPGVNRIVVTAFSSTASYRQDVLYVRYTPSANSTSSPAADTQAPTAPGSLGANSPSSTQVNLSWAAATDSVGVTGYKIERCQGGSCVNFAQIATATGTTYSNTGLTGATTYRFRVRATDAANNLSAYSTTATVTTPATVVANRPPVISGSSPSSVVAATAYSFTPTASDPDGQKLTFSVMGAPTWASFDSATGRLSGTPGAGNVGLTEGIVITASDGSAYASLPAFSLAVVQVATGSATVSWLPPTQRTDGSALTNLAGYRIRYGTNAAALTQTIGLDNPGLTSYMIEGLTPATWYFSVSAVDAEGVESTDSNIGSKKIL
jgi:hypothetical protein